MLQMQWTTLSETNAQKQRSLQQQIPKLQENQYISYENTHKNSQFPTSTLYPFMHHSQLCQVMTFH